MHAYWQNYICMHVQLLAWKYMDVSLTDDLMAHLLCNGMNDCIIQYNPVTAFFNILLHKMLWIYSIIISTTVRSTVKKMSNTDVFWWYVWLKTVGSNLKQLLVPSTTSNLCPRQNSVPLSYLLPGTNLKWDTVKNKHMSGGRCEYLIYVQAIILS